MIYNHLFELNREYKFCNLFCYLLKAQGLFLICCILDYDSKSRKGLELLEESKKDYKIKLYLSEDLSFSEIKNLIKKLKMKPQDLIRKNEKVIKEEGLKFDDTSDDEIISLLIEYPILIERPILVSSDKAIVGRPPELIKSMLK